MERFQILQKTIPPFRHFKCKEAVVGSSYLIEDLTIKKIAEYMGIGCIADPEEAHLMSQLTGVTILGNSVWVRCQGKLEVGKIYEGYLHSTQQYELPELKVGTKNLEDALPAVRLFKCKDAELYSSYLLEDLTIKWMAKHMGIGCIPDPEEACLMSQIIGTTVVGHSVWVRCRGKLEVGKTYEGSLHEQPSGLPELKLRHSGVTLLHRAVKTA